MKLLLGFIVLLGLSSCASKKVIAQPAERLNSRSEYIEMYKDAAVREMLQSGVPASITLAQGILESDNGNSPLAKYANNHFGIKCHSGWKGPSFIQDDDEKNECFRKYYSVYDSFKDHSEFLSGRKRYERLFKLKITDYKGWAKGLSKCGYATNPKYAPLLIRLIEENNLSRFDKAKKMPTIKVDQAKPKVEKPKLNQSGRAIVKVSDNRIKYTYAKSGDSYKSVAKRHGMNLWQIKKYNEFPVGYQLSDGEVVYLQPKRNKSKKHKAHQVVKGDTLFKISQKYGVKMSKLMKYNKIQDPKHMMLGAQISLRKK